jgi:ribosome-binding factor A
MPREFSRTVRVAQTIKRAMAPLVSDWMRDHQHGMASVTAADVSPDLKRSRVYVSVYGCDDGAAAIASLNDDVGRFRHALSSEVRLRKVPGIEFVLDESIEHGDTMSRMLDSLRPEDQDD